MSYNATAFTRGLRSCFAYLTYQFTCPTFKSAWRWTKARLNGEPYSKAPSVRSIIVAQLKAELRFLCSRRVIFVVGFIGGLAVYDIELGRFHSWFERHGLTVRIESGEIDPRTGMPLQPIYKETDLRTNYHI